MIVVFDAGRANLSSVGCHPAIRCGIPCRSAACRAGFAPACGGLRRGRPGGPDVQQVASAKHAGRAANANRRAPLLGNPDVMAQEVAYPAAQVGRHWRQRQALLALLRGGLLPGPGWRRHRCSALPQLVPLPLNDSGGMAALRALPSACARRDQGLYRMRDGAARSARPSPRPIASSGSVVKKISQANVVRRRQSGPARECPASRSSRSGANG